MLVWEDSRDLETTLFLEVRKQIEKLGSKLLSSKAKQSSDKEGYKWVKDFKVWEYPFAFRWLEKQRKSKGDFKVMDFGCGFTPFTEFLNLQGYQAIGVDHQFIGYPIKIDQALLKQEYPNSEFYLGDMKELPDHSFDAIISNSVIEHILPHTFRLEVMKVLKKKLKSSGKSLHIIDYYFPEKLHRDSDKRINVYDLMMEFKWKIGDMKFCPGSDSFNFEEIRNQINFTRRLNQESRIAIGND